MIPQHERVKIEGELVNIQVGFKMPLCYGDIRRTAEGVHPISLGFGHVVAYGTRLIVKFHRGGHEGEGCYATIAKGICERPRALRDRG